MAGNSRPIWKDTIVTLTSGATTGVAFRIQTNGTTIYTGTCWPKPGTSVAKVKINDICADYLANVFPLEGTDKDCVSFSVQAYISNTWTTIYTTDFYRDWSYDRSRTPGSSAPCDPVLDIVHPLQYLPLWSANGSYAWTDTLAGGTTSAGSASNAGNFYFRDLSGVSNLASVAANGRTYKVADLCGGYVLYYLNGFGGWDSLPVQGRTMRSLALNRHTKEVMYNNDPAAYARGRDNYVTEVDAEYLFNIGPLNSQQSARMWHLLGSTFVYVHDIEAGQIYPLLLTDTAHEIKDRRGEMHFYELKAVIAQERLRR